MGDTVLVDQPTAQPTNKVTAGAVGGAISAILAYLLKELAGVELEPEVAIAIATLITFASGYLVRDREV